MISDDVSAVIILIMEILSNRYIYFKKSQNYYVKSLI